MNKFELFKNINNDIKNEINLFLTLYNHKVIKNYKLNKYNKILNNDINYKNNSIKIEAIDAKQENRTYYLFYINKNKIGIFILDNDVDYIIISIFGPIYDLFKPDILLEYMLEYIKKHFNDKKIIYRDLTYFLKKNISSSKIYTLLYGYP